MERFSLGDLNQGDELIITTESGSTYRLTAEKTPEPTDEGRLVYRGLRATRESDHEFHGRPELIQDDPAVITMELASEKGVLRTGECLSVAWDRDHSESKRDWDMQFGPKFTPFRTSRIVGIEVVPVEE